MNLIVLVGNLGHDPEVKTTQDGTMVASFSLATKGYKDKTDWHKVVSFGKLAGLVGGHLNKGNKVGVEGTLTYNTWEDRDGNKRTQAQVIANRIEFLTPKEKADAPEPAGSQSPPDEDVPF